VPSYNANINVTVSGQNRLDYVLASVEKLNSIVSRLKPINLLAPGAGQGGDAIRVAKKQFDDFARAVVNFEPQGIQKRAKELSNTLAGSAAQADALGIALANVGLKSGGFKQQTADVRNYALALEAANQNARRTENISRSVQRGARIETIAQRFNTTPEAVEQRINNIRDIRYKKQRQAAAEEYMQQKRAENFELRLNQIREKNLQTQQRQSRQKEALSNAVIGGAFPLLFGQGVGAAVGGGLGGAAGGFMGGQMGFGLSLVGTVLGQQFDVASKTASDFAKSLKEGGDAAGFLKTNLSGVNPETLTFISNLQQSGQTAEAAKVAFNELAKAIGKDNAQALQTAGENANKYKSIIDKLVLSFVAAGYRANEFFDRLTRNPLNEQKTFTERSLESLFPGAAGPTKTQTQEADQRVKVLTKETDILRTQAALNTLSAKSTLEKFVVYSKLLATQEFLKAQAEIEYKFKTGTVSKEERLLLLGQARLQLQIDLNNTERQRIEEERRRQEEAKRLAEEAAQKQEAALRARTSIQKEIYDTEVAVAEQLIKREEFAKGESAALSKQINFYETILGYKFNSLAMDRRAALAEAAKVGTTKQTIQLFERRKQLLEDELMLQRQQAAARKLIIDIEKAEQVRTAAKPVTDFVQQQNLQNSLTKEYNKLLMEGVLPAEAKRIVTFNEVVKQQLLENENQVKNLELQIALAEASTIEAEAKGAVVTKLKEELALLEKKAEAIKGAAKDPGAGKTDAERLEDAAAAARGELLELTDPVNQIIAGAKAIGSAFRDAFTGLVSGAMTGQEALAAFFKGVGDHFMDMAAQMIAKLIEIYILQTILGFIGGRAGKGLEPRTATGNAKFMDRVFSTPLAGAGYAEGGFVTGPTRALIGEGSQPEYIIPASKMRGAMNRYAAGARGSAVIPAGDGGGGGGGTATMVAAPAAIDVRYSVERINSVDYVTNDQFQRGMQQAAAQGAAQGERRALTTLRQNTTQRKRIGL